MNPANESVARRFFEELWSTGDLAVADAVDRLQPAPRPVAMACMYLDSYVTA